MTEQRIFSLFVTLIEPLLIVDISAKIQQIKGFSEFVLVKDWLELKWNKKDVWTATPAFNFRPSKIHNYGAGVYYGFDFYSSNPTVNWLLTTSGAATWATTPTHIADLTVYLEATYGAVPYSGVADAQWIKPTNEGQQAWTNSDGESHN